MPLIDIYEIENALVFEVDIPRIDPTNLSAGVYEDLLVIEGIMTETYDRLQSGILRYLCVERSINGFRRV